MLSLAPRLLILALFVPVCLTAVTTSISSANALNCSQVYNRKSEDILLNTHRRLTTTTDLAPMEAHQNLLALMQGSGREVRRRFFTFFGFLPYETAIPFAINHEVVSSLQNNITRAIHYIRQQHQAWGKEQYEMRTGNESSLRLMSLNLGLLKPFAGKKTGTPGYKERSATLDRSLKEHIGPESKNPVDVLVLQELWYRGDIENANSIANSFGFRSLFEADIVHASGLQILVRDNANIEILDYSFIPYINQRSQHIVAYYESFWKPWDKTKTFFGRMFQPQQRSKRADRELKLVRGLAIVKIKVGDNIILVGNTHFTVGKRSGFMYRYQSIRALGRILNKLDEHSSPEEKASQTLLLGDWNIPSRFSDGSGSPPTNWSQAPLGRLQRLLGVERLNYLYLLDHLGMFDLAAAHNYDPGTTLNPKFERIGFEVIRDQTLDHAFGSSQPGRHLSVETYKILEDPVREDTGYPRSDHLPVYLKVMLR